MRITKIDLQNNLIGGLHPVKMEKLGKVVVIAGKNGAGKSRLLQNIQIALSKTAPPGIMKSMLSSVKNLEGQISSIERANELNTLDQLNLSKLQHCEQDLLRVQAEISQYPIVDLLQDKGVRYVIEFVPKIIELNDPMNQSKAALSHMAKNIGNILGVTDLNHSALSCIQYIQDTWREASNPDYAYPEEKENAIASYRNLDDSIFAFLGTHLSRDKNGTATLFGQEIGKANLSQGQIVLLQLCIALYAQGAKLNESIIMMDEPENHLHPEALIELINKVQSVLTDGQLWIATHSIHLLAHCSPSSIWYMQDGSISYSGKIPERVLHGLMGGEDQVNKLADFLNLPAQMASVQFAFECLLAPIAVQTGGDDPQTQQIIDAIKSLVNSKKKIKILDFGAGQGRLLSAIRDSDDSNEIPIISWLDYFAYDLPDAYEKECTSIISEIYGSSEGRYFSDSQKMLNELSMNTFDMVVMCNVFHEIPPAEWLNMFNKHSICRSCLKKDNGILLIVEDQLIPVGEKAYEGGFLVFDQSQFKKLFDIDTYKTLSRKNDRLKAHFIPAKNLSNISSDTRRDAIDNFKNLSLDKIKHLRKSQGNTSNGRLHAFWSQQVVNSILALEQIG